MKRFLNYLRVHNRLKDFGFFSFEWYPFDNVCKPPIGQLIEHTDMMKKAFDRLDKEGVPRDIPWIISEYGFSAFAGKAEVELPSALLNTEIVAQFLTFGGQTAYFYGLEPNEPISEMRCGKPEMQWGNLMMIQAGPDNKAKWRLPAYYGAKMLQEEWAEPTKAPHQLFRTTVLEGDKVVNDVTAYAIHRPDNRWAVMILNKNSDSIKLEEVQFDKIGAERVDWNEPIDVIQYSPRQYTWRSNGDDGHPVRSNPPEYIQLHEGMKSGLVLPPLSLTVVRSTIPN